MGRELYLSPPRQKSDPVIPQDRPVYRILAEKGFFGPDDTLHPEGEVIVLWDTPNEDMEPMNQMATDIFEKYIDTLEESAKLVAESNGRYFSGRSRNKEDLIANASADARRVQIIQNGPGTPIMGARKDSDTRIQKVGPQEIPEVGAAKAKRGKIETISAA